MEKIRKEYAALETQEKPRLYQLAQLIVEKTTDAVTSLPSSSPTTTSYKNEGIHLKKMDPPRFTGKEVDFPEFYRKWQAIVVPARLPVEAEIDRLRDALPKDSKEMLTGVTQLSKAWDILKKRFGDEDLIATKLKHELKGLTISEKSDHERIISLVIKIRALVSRLESLKASDALKYDGEFISSCLNAIKPSGLNLMSLSILISGLPSSCFLIQLMIMQLRRDFFWPAILLQKTVLLHLVK